MSLRRPVRAHLLIAALAAALLATAVPAGQAAARPDDGREERTTATAPHAPRGASGTDPGDRVKRLAAAPKAKPSPAPPPGGLPQGRTPGARNKQKPGATRPTAAGVPCTLDALTRLSPDGLVAFLADPAVTGDGCLRDLLWTWDARLAPVFSPAHAQAVARRIAALSAAHDGANGSHLYEMFTYLHAAAYHDFSRSEIDLTDPVTVDAVRRAADAFGAAPRTFEATRANADTLREALYAASSPGLRQHQLPLVKRVLATMDARHPATNTSAAWGGSALAALSVNYLGVYPGNNDTAFRDAVTRDAAYRAAFQDFASYTHLKGTANAWVVRDALGEYGRFGQIDALKPDIVRDLGALVDTTTRNFGEGSQPWAKVAGWLVAYDACAPYRVCKADIERRIFPRTYTYDSGGIKVRTALDEAAVDQLYYASKQVRAQFHRVLGTTEPLAGDTNTTLNIVLYASRADYETYHPLLTGMGTDNGGIYIERGATFYTYQRRVPQDSSLTLEELFRHEYTHYLNGRWAVPGSFGEGPWYEGDRTTAMDEGTAEFFDGATRHEGIAVRKALVRGVIADTANGRPRMTVRQLLHATYDGDGFRFYDYAGTFFEFLWRERPAQLAAMYGHLRGNDVSGFDAWRERMSGDGGLQRAYDAFLDAQIARVDDLFVPDTTFQPPQSLKYGDAGEAGTALASATGIGAECREAVPGPGKRRFACTGRITANLTDAGSPDAVFRDMSGTVDYYLLERSLKAGNNFPDMNCSFGRTDIWSNGRAGTAPYSCEGPLRS
ncbi:collagenase [Streptomyces sp. ODS28]|uniref:collagenase n=1 Tax=Streptomyces sp. ODS28 TaxID=3136688 RepID=UPI0031E6AD99